MAYKIAVATSDGETIDVTFGSAKSFLIYEVANGIYEKAEERFFDGNLLDNSCSNTNNCGNSDGCNSGCGGHGGSSEKVELISDCRAVVCKKVGFQIQKQLERKAISYFDVECRINEALEKITAYYSRIDGRNKK